MKRFTLFVALALMVAMPAFAERVTSETARKVATTFLNNNGTKANHLTDLSKEAGFPNLYIFTAEQGFVVISADDCVQPILGYSLTGKFQTENMPTNVRGWLEGYNDEIQYAIESKMSATIEIVQLWEDLKNGKSNAATTTVVVDALVQTQWDQNPLYNNLCPSNPSTGELTVTGCAATAMAQIMKYWGYPSQGIGSHSYTPASSLNLGVQFANFGATTYQWNDMPIQLSNSSTTTQINAVATLMYHCGVSIDMKYNIGSNGGSSAYAEDIPNALITYFNYKTTANIKYKDNYSNVNDWINLLKTELDASRPIEYNGRGDGGGHAFVCDGYDSNNNFHFNWGWSGRNDGFYALTNLVPGSGGAGGGSYNFTQNQCAIFGIEPSTNIPSPTNLTYTLSGLQNVTLNWSASIGASSYVVYRNNNLIGNTTSTTYADIAPFGTNDYYIRAVDSNGQQSLPSNTVTITIDYLTPVVDDLVATLSGNNINLSWSAPEWCYPETPTATLTYGDDSPYGSVGTGSTGSSFYWGNRHFANDLTEYNGKTLYKVSFYANAPGAYECFIFKGTGVYSSYNYPIEEIAHFITTTSNTGWTDIDFDETVEIDSSQDLWIFIYDPVGREYPASYSIFTEHANGGYYSSAYPNANVSGFLPATFGNVAWLIKAYITDGTYTYNLYRNGTTLATNLTTTSYIDQNRNNTASFYTVKTNYYGGETAASNGVGFALGQASISTLTLNANDQMTVTENSKLTVSGDVINTNSDNLVLEDGAQLVHNSEGVMATVQKNIEPYSSNEDGWNFIASPVIESITPSADNGLITNNYDLYIFDQSQDLEWRNIKAGSFSNINYKTGYLYANSGNSTLTFAGTLAATTEPTVLTYDANATLKGFNLIGNPYPCRTTIANDFYVISNNMVSLAENGATIAPCESVFVKATGTGESVTFTKIGSAKGSSSKDCFDLVIMQDNANIDRARVRFGKGIGMEKYTLNPDNTQIWFRQNGEDFAVAYVNGQDEIPLNFKASQNGTYTLGIEAQSLDLDYLHLIDNITGADIDLLSTSSYTFEAKTSDYASRFRLVFATNDVDTNDSFVYVVNGQLHVLEQGEAELQVIDAMGHVLICRDALNMSPIKGLTPGVYVVRLIKGSEVKTQKVVIQ